ncbi:MAG: beta-glucuronidase [Ruminococcaceae bacterium]|nr:beta-glucuronidase [Oscillospiraceae bacterium]
MANVKLSAEKLPFLRTMNPRLISYNVEMTEVTGGTFWKAYTDAQIDGTQQVPPPDMSKGVAGMHQWYDPIDTTNPRLIKLAKALDSCWVRVSGTWATRTYYDFDGTGMPEGYFNHLRKEQWINLLNFVKAVGGKLMISVANCDGLHSHDEPWNPSQAKLIFDLSREQGCPIEAVEFVNEPNMLKATGFPKDYTAADFRRDQDIFHKWVRENYPECTIVGPSDTDPNAMSVDAWGNPHPWVQNTGGMDTAGIAAVMAYCSTADLMDGCSEKLDVFSYHYYNGVSERMAAMMPSAFTPAEGAMSEAYLGAAAHTARCFTSYRDRYCPGGEMWVTESGDAGAGGHTWASTYLEVPRTLNEIGGFATVTNGVIFHNTLASSDYGWLKHGTFVPRPSYFAVLLWKQLMGNDVYDSGIPVQEGAHVYAHSRADGIDGTAYLIINNSWSEETTVHLPKSAKVYALTNKDGNMRSRTMLLNGKELVLGENDALPVMEGVETEGTVTVAPGGCTFIVV